ncbi:Mpo1 family 2-hydroxy fatty acid dioxygenase [Pseudoalteromonas sp. T1lg88]|uniref:Mpo1 family 2-hydroxy fatty acid dioxygenase n=1 Tax=Pseudoalteromonas sp. T1lg88 TaxID=2077104 RepID=UPI000CF6D535|nr:Mpo1-like protein [Pseudoalteromonas sp. T1lg88]
MKSLVSQLANYAHYHRDMRNIYTHFIGIPLIVYALAVLLSRPNFTLTPELTLTPATIAVAITCVYYLFLSLSLGLVMTVLMAAVLVGAAPLAALPWPQWLGWGVGLFLLGWLFQFVGHYFEGKKPAFVDDLIGLVIGPLFVVVELLFMLGLYKGLKQDIEQIAGKVR